MFSAAGAASQYHAGHLASPLHSPLSSFTILKFSAKLLIQVIRHSFYFIWIENMQLVKQFNTLL